MKQHSTPLRLSAALLLASTGLPLTSALAQEVQPQADPTTATPPADTSAPPPPTAEPTVAAPVVEAPAPAPTRSEPVVNTRASGLEPASPDASGEAPAAERRATRQRTAPSTARAAAPVRPRAAAQPRAVTAPPPAPAPEPAPVDDATSPLAATGAAPAPSAAAPAPADVPATGEAAPATTDASPVADPEQGGGVAGFWPWLVAGALAIGALLLFARRRRRRVDDEADYVAYDEPVAVFDEPVAAAPVHHEPAPTAHILEEPVVSEPAPVAAAAASASAGRPWLDLAIRPVRAGVGDDAARVEFELGVENNGSAPASDVRISAWLLNGNSPEPSEMERALIDRSSAQQRVETMIEPGDGTRIATAVALPREGLEDAILPVVVADARYRLPDGGEGHTAAAFAVGVSRDGELVMFDVDNPSGMHEGVEARLHGQPHRD